jgi:hypothetical protein
MFSGGVGVGAAVGLSIGIVVSAGDIAAHQGASHTVNASASIGIDADVSDSPWTGSLSPGIGVGSPTLGYGISDTENVHYHVTR